MLALLGLIALSFSVEAFILPPSLTRRNDSGPLVNVSSPTGNWKWRETNQIFSFGDSYTYEETTVVPNGGTAGNGPNWIQYLTEIYNVSSPINRWNGAVIDNDVITPKYPGNRSFKQQVESFEAYAANGSSWDPEKTLCSAWIGINDIGFSYAWTNVSIPEFYAAEIENLHSLVTRLANLEACRAYLFITVPPLGSIPLYFNQGNEVSDSIAYATEAWNVELKEMARQFEREQNETWVGVFDSGKTIIRNGEALGYTNVTGYNVAYPIQWGIKQPGNNSQIEPFLPMSSYVFQDELHPTWSVQNLLAHSIATFLGAVHVV